MSLKPAAPKLGRQYVRQRRVDEVLVERRQRPFHQVPIVRMPGDRSPVHVPQHEPATGTQQAANLPKRGSDVLDVLEDLHRDHPIEALVRER